MGGAMEAPHGRRRLVELSLVRPKLPCLPPPHPLAGWLPSGPLCRFWVLRARLSRFTPSSGPMDPCACTWLVGRVLPWIESVFPCSLGVFSPLMHLHTNIHQDLWNLLVITPTTNVDAYLLCVYAGVDGLDLPFKSRQQQLLHIPNHSNLFRYPQPAHSPNPLLNHLWTHTIHP
jgi:hypothetical protein